MKKLTVSLTAISIVTIILACCITGCESPSVNDPTQLGRYPSEDQSGVQSQLFHDNTEINASVVVEEEDTN